MHDGAPECRPLPGQRRLYLSVEQYCPFGHNVRDQGILPLSDDQSFPSSARERSGDAGPFFQSFENPPGPVSDAEIQKDSGSRTGVSFILRSR